MFGGTAVHYFYVFIRLYSESSLTLKECSWRVSVVPYYASTHPQGRREGTVGQLAPGPQRKPGPLIAREPNGETPSSGCRAKYVIRSFSDHQNSVKSCPKYRKWYFRESELKKIPPGSMLSDSPL